MIWVERLLWLFALGVTVSAVSQLAAGEAAIGLLGIIAGLLLGAAAFGLGVSRGRSEL